ncbi:probable cytochrome P450 6a13 [Diachasma alloeum]|uniref:probable cytochrome P450 6a13 n=1 Tax=Diachasma alloeum TaxID=454923 RepID=UPI0010FB8038|nr:probable cytochrome P450 6a13 [Diachasma alloeum]
MLVINDLDLIKIVLVKEFSTFAGRGLNVDEKNEPLSANLFALDGPRWKDLRKKLTPVFTSGKLKHMFDLILECSDHFEKYLKEQIGNGKVIECKEPIARFTTDVIGSCAFGLDTSALENSDSEFRRIGKKIFEPNFITMIKRLIREISPGLAKFLGLRGSSKQVEDFFISVIKDTIALRERENIVRHDFVDTLISMKRSNDVNEWKFTDANLAAQALVFFAAGFETSSTTISFALLELSHTPELQEKLRKEILETMKNCDGKLTYEIVSEMKYLDMVVQETLRKDSPALLLTRHAFQSYKVPGTDFTIEKGMSLFIPIYAIHHDPEYFPDPEVFDPERFSDEARRLRHPMAHIPFGDGPKNCIGS